MVRRLILPSCWYLTSHSWTQLFQYRFCLYMNQCLSACLNTSKAIHLLRMFLKYGQRCKHDLHRYQYWDWRHFPQLYWHRRVCNCLLKVDSGYRCLQSLAQRQTQKQKYMPTKLIDATFVSKTWLCVWSFLGLSFELKPPCRQVVLCVQHLVRIFINKLAFIFRI